MEILTTLSELTPPGFSAVGTLAMLQGLDYSVSTSTAVVRIVVSHFGLRLGSSDWTTLLKNMCRLIKFIKITCIKKV